MKSTRLVPYFVSHCLLAVVLALSCPTLSFAKVATLQKKQKKKKQKPVFDRFLTIGFGLHMGYLYAGSSQDVSADSRIVFGFNAHLRLFRSIAVTVSYDFNAASSIDGVDTLVPYPSLRLMGHLYVAQSGPMFMNLFAGVGFHFSKANGGDSLVAYLLGTELGFKISERFTIVGVCRFLLPSYAQVMRSFSPQQLSSSLLAKYPHLYYEAVNRQRVEVLRRMFDFQNVQIAVNFRVFL